MKDIGKNIKALRTAKKITQDELAQMLFVTRQTVSNYETGKSRPDIDMLVQIAQALNTDIHQLIYGPEPRAGKVKLRALLVGAGLFGLFLLLWVILTPIAREYAKATYHNSWQYSVLLLIRPLCLIFGGWTAMHLIGMALKWEPPAFIAAKWIRTTLLVLLIFWLIFTTCWCAVCIVDDWMFMNHIRGEWQEHDSGLSWSRLPLELPVWIEWINLVFLQISIKFPSAHLLSGTLLWLCGFPDERSKTGC